LHKSTQISRPEGGYILWVSLPRSIETKALHLRALDQGISIAPGMIFSNTEQFNHCLRINCAVPWEREAQWALMTLGRLAVQVGQEML